jgi:hypothetical protein
MGLTQLVDPFVIIGFPEREFQNVDEQNGQWLRYARDLAQSGNPALLELQMG